MRTSIRILLLLWIISFCACYEHDVRRKKYTPDEFLNHTVVRKDDYIKDSILLMENLKDFLSNREDFFKNTAYSDSTGIIIDSILYSPDLKKYAVFVITKNPTSRQIMPNKNYEWYYDGTCYLGVKYNDSIRLSWIGPSFTNSNNKVELSDMMRDSYFTEFATQDTAGPYTYKYNLNDIRFWDCPIWKEIEEKEMKRRLFEEEKKKHPENVYEPDNKK